MMAIQILEVKNYMERKWLIYNEPPTRVTNGLYLSINKIGELMLGRGSFEAIGRPEAVYLMYDPDNDLIGLRKTEPLMTNAFALRAKGDSGNFVVRAKPLCVKHDLRFDGTVQFLETSVEGETLIAHLLKTRPVRKRSSPNRKRPK